MAATSSNVPLNPFRVDVVSCCSPSANLTKTRSPARQHRLGAPGHSGTGNKTSTDAIGAGTTTPAVNMKPESPPLEIRESRRPGSVRPRSDKSRDMTPHHSREVWSRQAQSSDHTNSGQNDGSKASKNPPNALSTPGRRDVARRRRTGESLKTAHAMSSIGAWSEPSPYRALQLPPDVFEDARAKGSQPSLPTPPMTPDIGRLGTPDLAPMAFDVEFCACGDCQEDCVSDTWHLAGRDKYDVQCKYRLCPWRWILLARTGSRDLKATERPLT